MRFPLRADADSQRFGRRVREARERVRAIAEGADLAEVAARPQPGDVIQVGNNVRTRKTVVWALAGQVSLLSGRDSQRPQIHTLGKWQSICARPGTRVVRMVPRGS